MPKKPAEDNPKPAYTPADPVAPVHVPGIEFYGGVNPTPDPEPAAQPAPGEHEE